MDARRNKLKLTLTIPRWVIFVLGALVVGGLASGVTYFAITNSNSDIETPTATSTPDSTANTEDLSDDEIAILAKIPEADVCGAALDYAGVSYTVSADGRSAVLSSPDGWQVKCITYWLEGPSSIYERVLTTRAIDGTQTAIWGNWTASWNYHPDTGVNFIVQHG